jgi:hypothetical protein
MTKVELNLFKVINNLIYELNMAIDEINTMRDINHRDNLTPADHWDKEGLHIAQLALKELKT